MPYLSVHRTHLTLIITKYLLTKSYLIKKSEHLLTLRTDHPIDWPLARSALLSRLWSTLQARDTKSHSMQPRTVLAYARCRIDYYSWLYQWLLSLTMSNFIDSLSLIVLVNISIGVGVDISSFRVGGIVMSRFIPLPSAPVLYHCRTLAITLCDLKWCSLKHLHKLAQGSYSYILWIEFSRTDGCDIYGVMRRVPMTVSFAMGQNYSGICWCSALPTLIQ